MKPDKKNFSIDMLGEEISPKRQKLRETIFLNL